MRPLHANACRCLIARDVLVLQISKLAGAQKTRKLEFVSIPADQSPALAGRPNSMDPAYALRRATRNREKAS